MTQAQLATAKTLFQSLGVDFTPENLSKPLKQLYVEATKKGKKCQTDLSG